MALEPEGCWASSSSADIGRSRIVSRVGRHSDVTSSAALASGTVVEEDMYLLPPPTATPTSPATANDFKAKLLRMWGILSIESKGSVCIRGRCRSGAPLARLVLMGAVLPRGGQRVSGFEVGGLPAGLFEIASVIWIAMGQARGGVPTIMSSIKHSLPKPVSPLPTHSGRPDKSPVLQPCARYKLPAGSFLSSTHSIPVVFSDRPNIPHGAHA